MYNKYNFEKQMEKEAAKYHYDIATKTFNDEQGNFLCTLDTFWDRYAKKSGLSFECIHDEHVSCFSLLRCTECGAVIHYSYDEGYEPNFSCPVCTDYKTHYKYWTKDDILSDLNKQKYIDAMIEMDKWEEETYKLKKKRNGLNSWELWKTSKEKKNKKYDYSFECSDIREGWWKGLKFNINIWKKAEELNGYLWEKKISIPLSWSAFYIQFIYRHLGKCHKDLRSKFYIGKGKQEVNKINILS
jgi:hypothetical protein